MIVKKIIKSVNTRESFRNVYNKRDQGNIEEMVQDPYCGKYMTTNKAVRIGINGQELFFCSTQCADLYKADLYKKN